MWDCLLGFSFQRSQHNIEFGSVLGWILVGFGLHFGKVLGTCWRQKLSEMHAESKLVFKTRIEAEKRLKKPIFLGSAPWGGGRCREGVPQLGEG